MKRRIIAIDFDGVIVYSLGFLNWENEERLADFKRRFLGNLHERKKSLPSGFFKIYSEGIKEYKIPEETIKTIKELSKKYLLFIVSSNRENFIVESLKRNNVHYYFRAILGVETAESKVEKFQKISPEIFITDTVGDVKEAIEAKIRRIIVYVGEGAYHSREWFEEYSSSVEFIDNFSELVDLL